MTIRTETVNYQGSTVGRSHEVQHQTNDRDDGQERTCRRKIGLTINVKIMRNKKVLLRERKRHTARRVVSTHSDVLSWLTPPRLADPPPSWLTPPWLTDLPPSWLTPPPGWVSSLPPSLGVDKLTKWNYYLPVVLRTRAVMTGFEKCNFFRIR